MPRHPDEAITFLKFLTTPEVAGHLGRGRGDQPGRRRSGVADVDPQMASMAELLASADAMVPPPDTTYPVAVAEAYYQAAAYAASGEKIAAGRADLA